MNAKEFQQRIGNRIPFLRGERYRNENETRTERKEKCSFKKQMFLSMYLLMKLQRNLHRYQVLSWKLEHIIVKNLDSNLKYNI